MRHRFINHARNIWDRAGGQGLHAREVGLLRFVCRLHGWGMGLLCSVCRWWAGELLSATRRRATCVLLGCMAAWNKGAHLAAFNVHLPTVPLLPRIDQRWLTAALPSPLSLPDCCSVAAAAHRPAVVQVHPPSQLTLLHACPPLTPPLQCPCCRASTSCGTSTSTWRRCWATWRGRAKSLSAGCSGSPTTTAGWPTSRCVVLIW